MEMTPSQSASLYLDPTRPAATVESRPLLPRTSQSGTEIISWPIALISWALLDCTQTHPDQMGGRPRHGANPPTGRGAAIRRRRQHSGDPLHCSDDDGRKMVLSTNYHLTDLEDELYLCALILSYSPKNESTWSHRRWVIKKVAQHHHDMSDLIHKESLLVKEIAEKSKMNYRAWRHRCWLIPYMKRKQVLDELNKSTRWTELHVADNCCFHYRRSLLLALLDNHSVDNEEDSLNWQSEAHLLWKEELRWNEMLIRRYQGRESLWIHRRFLSQWWVQHLLNPEETFSSKESSLVDLFLAQEIHLLSDCLNAPGDDFGETSVQAELAALYILWISKQDAVVKRKVEERMQSVGSLKEVLARACLEKNRLCMHLLPC